MSYTETDAGRQLQRLIKNPNYTKLFDLLSRFAFITKGYSLESDEWLNLYRKFREDFSNSIWSRRCHKADIHQIYDWFINFISKDYKLTDYDIREIKKGFY